MLGYQITPLEVDRQPTQQLVVIVGIECWDTGTLWGAWTRAITFGWLLLGLSAGIPGASGGMDSAANQLLVSDGVECWDTEPSENADRAIQPSDLVIDGIGAGIPGAPLGHGQSSNLRLVIDGIVLGYPGTPLGRGQSQPTFGWLLLVSAGIPAPSEPDRAANLRFGY